MDDTQPKKTEEEIKREQELAQKKDMLQKINFSQLPGLFPDHHIKGLMMVEDEQNVPILTEWEDTNRVRLAVRVQAQGYAFHDDVRTRAVELLEQKMISLKRKSREEHVKMVTAPGPGEMPMGQEQGEVKKPSLLERIKGKL